MSYLLWTAPLWQPASAESVQFTAESLAWGLLAAGLVAVGGAAFGLSTKLLHLDKLTLELKARNSLKRQEQRVRKVLDLVARYHQTYVALLLVSTLSLTAVPAILYSLYPRPWTCFLAWGVLVCMGCFIPLVWFTGPKELSRLCAFSTPLKFTLFLLSPVVRLLSSLLDRFSFPVSDSSFSLSHLKKSLFLHSEAVVTASADTLSLSQLSMLHSLLDSSSLPVLLSMLPMDKVFSVSQDALMCEELLEEIGRRGFSRLPVTSGNKVVGVIHVSALLQVDKQRTVVLEQAGIPLETPLYVQKDAALTAVLIALLESKEQMAIVVDSSVSDLLTDLGGSPALGIITQADLMALVLKVRKTQESSTPPSSAEMISQDSLVLGKVRKGSYTAFDFEETHSQDVRGTTDVERSGY